MAGTFSVRTEPRFDRLAKALRRRHADFTDRYEEAIAILRKDPFNRAGTQPIKKLTDVRPGEGQYRLRLRRWRFRYDVRGQDVVLQSCGLRDEKTYR